jgi:hypothetical protein
MPLYMESIMAMLRNMETFDYSAFREELTQQTFSNTQKAMLNLRLSLLDSCLKGGTTENRIATHFSPGTLTIIELVFPDIRISYLSYAFMPSLSSQFMDGSSACGFFDMILGLFVEADIPAGKLVGI